MAEETTKDQEIIELTDERRIEIKDELKNKIKDDIGMGELWKDIMESSHIMFGNKPRNVKEVVKYIKSSIKLPSDMSTADVRSKELEIGNILQAISTELAMASYNRDILAERKKDYLADAKDRRKSKDVIESELAKFNKEFKYVRGLYMSADLNYKFWKSMHDLIIDTLDRLKHVGITLASESRVDNYMNQPVTNKRGNKV